jgi:hypothetical protein
MDSSIKLYVCGKQGCLETKASHPPSKQIRGVHSAKNYQQVYEQSEPQKHTYFMSVASKVVNKPRHPIHLASKVGMITGPKIINKLVNNRSIRSLLIFMSVASKVVNKPGHPIHLASKIRCHIHNTKVIN